MPPMALISINRSSLLENWLGQQHFIQQDLVGRDLWNQYETRRLPACFIL